MDCTEKGQYSAIIPKTAESYLIFNFKSSFSLTNGKAKISLKENKLIWEIIESPKGEFYCPTHALMMKQLK